MCGQLFVPKLVEILVFVVEVIELLLFVAFLAPLVTPVIINVESFIIGLVVDVLCSLSVKYVLDVKVWLSLSSLRLLSLVLVILEVKQFVCIELLLLLAGQRLLEVIEVTILLVIKHSSCFLLCLLLKVFYSR